MKKTWSQTLIDWLGIADRAWQDGYDTAMAEAEDSDMQKDVFISEQELIVLRCMDVFDKAGIWDAVPSDLRERLRDYV